MRPVFPKVDFFSQPIVFVLTGSKRTIPSQNTAHRFGIAPVVSADHALVSSDHYFDIDERARLPLCGPTLKLTILLAAAAVVLCIFLFIACKKHGPQADAVAALARGEYQFVALLDPEGKWTRPEVPEIPAGYFETTGTRVRQTTAETQDADVAYMTTYNEALYRGLKAQGKFHVIEENIARVKANLENAQK